MRVRLHINIDHVATLRNARGTPYPDPTRAAEECLAAGADGITAHLREDRRHIRDDDVDRLREVCARARSTFNLEMAATDEMVAIALRVKPDVCTLVPERREERTTEGGLDVVAAEAALMPYVAKLRDAGIRVSLFIEPDRRALDAAVRLGAPVVELHTGAWCEAIEHGRSEKAAHEWQRIRDAAPYAESLGLEVHAGHGLDFATAERISELPQIAELNIGHFLVGEAIFIGLAEAIQRMRGRMTLGRARTISP
jgi:pyridoxine 5-phosphate synthase